VLSSSDLARSAHRYVLRDDRLRFPDGAEAVYSVVTSPDSAFVVPIFEDGDTMLVRQWRHAWDISSWEVPAGTCDGDEDPLHCARRELAEEAGIVAERYRSLGVVRGAAFLTGRAHLYLAEGLTVSDRAPEAYEQDMEVLRLPLDEALDAALEGEVVHSGSVTALCRAARALEII
jgi:ADP-ribose pyrophosphatase